MLKEYKTLFRYMGKYRINYILGFLSLIITSGGQLFIPQFYRQSIDLISSGSFVLEDILAILFQMLGVALIVALGRFGWRYWLHGAARRIETEIRQDLFKHFLTLDQYYYQDQKIGDLMARMTNDLRAIRMAASMALVAATDGIFMTLAILIILFGQNPQLTLITIIPLPFITIIILFIGRLLGTFFKRVQEGFSRLSEQSQETFSGIKVIKAFVKEGYFQKRYSEANDNYKLQNLRLTRLFGLFFPVVFFLAGLTSLILLRFGGEQVIIGNFSAGQFVATLSYLQMLIWPVLGAGFTVNLIQRGGASLARINEIFNHEPKIIGGDLEFKGSVTKGISITDLTFAYETEKETDSEELWKKKDDSKKGSRKNKGKDNSEIESIKEIIRKEVLRDISLFIPPGTTLGIAGPTGSGKTTLIKLFPRLLNYQSGKIELDGTELDEIKLHDLRSLFGVVPQDSFLFSDTIKNNINFGLEKIDEEFVQKAIETSTIDRDVSSFPDHFETMVGEKGITLSGGQKQRISIARALATEPEILIFDDALSAVDTETEDKILNHLINLRKGKTNIIVSHRISALAAADHIIVLDNGTIAQQGTHESLIEEPGYYQTIYNIQRLEMVESKNS